jgi:hypothetical protein
MKTRRESGDERMQKGESYLESATPEFTGAAFGNLYNTFPNY